MFFYIKGPFTIDINLFGESEGLEKIWNLTRLLARTSGGERGFSKRQEQPPDVFRSSHRSVL